MKRVLLILLLAFCVSPPVVAATQKSTQFRVRIVPLDCTIETIDYGDGPVQVVTCPEEPEPEPEPELELEPQPEPSPEELAPDAQPQEEPLASSRVIESAEELEEIFDRVPDGLKFTIQIEESLQQAQNRYANNILFGQIAIGVVVFASAGIASWQLFSMVRPDITITPLVGHRWEKLRNIFWRPRNK